MLTDKIKELAALRARAAALEAEVAQSRKHELSGLPAQYGFQSMDEFIAALRAAGGARRGRPPGRSASSGGARKAAASAPKPAAGGGKKRRTRAVITDATRAEVKKLVGQGKTGLEIAKAVGISLPSVQNIKAALGLVQKRKQ